jgi:catechol 1,2-dioxygenase
MTDVGTKKQAGDRRESVKVHRRAMLLGIPAAGLLGGLLLGCSDAGKAAADSGARADGSAGVDSSGADTRPAADSMLADARGADAASTCEATKGDALGPFHESGAPFRAVIAEASEPGTRTYVEGVVYGPDCKTPLVGAVLDIWHADASGSYHAAGKQYRLRGQVKTDASGRYAFESIRPGNYDNRPAHYHFIISQPGHQPLTTQIYFAGDPFLGPKDSCPPPTCNSADPGRVISFADKSISGKTLLAGSFDAVLKKA